MRDRVYVLWFEQEREDCDDCELLIGIYSSESEAKAAIDRVKNQKGFVDFPEGFHVYPYEVDKDHWTQGFIVD
jgi:homoserine kinase type II